MVDNLLYPVIAATLTTVGAGLLRDHRRETLQSRVEFYGREEERHQSQRLSEFQAAQRIRAQARLMALDHVRKTAAPPFGFFLVMAGANLFVGGRLLTGDGAGQGEAFFWLASGTASALVGAHTLLTVIRSFEARGAVIKSAIAGQVPAGPAINPLEEGESYRPAWRAVAMFVAMLGAPSALGAGIGSLETSPDAATAVLLSLGACAYLVIGGALAISWREMDKAVHREITHEVLRRFSLKNEASANLAGSRPEPRL